MNLNKEKIFSGLKLTLYFVAHWSITKISAVIVQTSIVQGHALAGRDNSVSAGTGKDPRWGVLAHI